MWLLITESLFIYIFHENLFITTKKGQFLHMYTFNVLYQGNFCKGVNYLVKFKSIFVLLQTIPVIMDGKDVVAMARTGK